MTKKEQILATALTLFIENGFEKTPTSLISKEAGVATGTLFHHFKTKEELIDALYIDVKTSILREMSTGLAGKQGVKEQFRYIWESFVAWVLKYPKKFQFLNQFKESPHISGNTRQKVGETFQFFNDMMNEGKRDGIFYDLPIDLLTMIAFTNISTICLYFLENPQDFVNEDFRETAFVSFWRSISQKE